MDNNIVALIDSGVNLYYGNLKYNIIKNITVEADDITSISDVNESNNHGTFCAAILKSFESNLPIYSIKILDRSNLSNYHVLNRALKYLQETDAKIINLSLATLNEHANSKLASSCNQLVKQGKIIVASTDNNCLKSYPAYFKNVIGVTGLRTLSINEHWFNHKYNIQCACDSSPIILSGLKARFNIFGGTSKATAIITAKIYRLLKSYGDIPYSYIMELLEKKATNNNWNENCDLLNSESKPSFKYLSNFDDNIMNKLKYALMKTLNLNIDILTLIKQRNMLEYGINLGNCCYFLQNIEEIFEIKISQPIQYYRLLTLESIIGLVEEFQNE